MQSQFSARTLAEIFRDLFLGERSGVLVLSREDEEKRIHFDRGMILFADSPSEAESLGACLVAGGKLSAGALAEAREQLDGSTATPDLADVLLRRELVGRATLNAAVRASVDRVVESIFGWEGGSGRFIEEPTPKTPFETNILVTVDVILKGIFCMSGFEPIHEAMQGLDNRLRVRTATPLPLERLTLSPAHGFILSRVDGNSSLNDVISILPPGEEEVAARFLFGLLILGLLEYDPALSPGPVKVADILKDHEDRQALEGMQEQVVRQTYTLIRDQNPHEILGVPPGAGYPEIERAYSERKEKFNRERILPRVRDKFRTELTLIESRLIEAYLTLTKPSGGSLPKSTPGANFPADDVAVQDLNVRVEIDRAKSKVAIDQKHQMADRYFAKVRKFMREGDFHNAIQFSRLAITQNPSDARYYYMLGDCLSRNPEPRWQRMAEENYAKATELDPWNADYWIGLGRLYRKQGLNLRAKKQFEEALKLVPNNVEVLTELKKLG